MSPLKAYFDGSKTDGKFTVLGCIAADETVWEALEAAWEAVRRERGNPPHIHMTDAISLEGQFKEWSAEDRDYLIDGLLSVFLQFTRNPRLHAFTCSVDLSAHRTLSQQTPLPSPEKICARILFPTMLDWYGKFPDPVLDLVDAFFDRNEGFLRYVQSDWTSKVVRKRYPAWNLMRTITTATMESTPPLQMVDLIAWGRNRLLSFSHHEKQWEIDPHYATAVRATNTLQGIWREVNAHALRNVDWKDEGYDAIDPQRRRFIAQSTSEKYKLDRLIKGLLKAPPDFKK